MGARHAHRVGTLLLSALMLVIGIALVVEALTGLGGISVRLLAGVLFVAGGAGRLYVELHRGESRGRGDGGGVRGRAGGGVRGRAAGDVRGRAAGDVRGRAAGDVRGRAAGDVRGGATGDGRGGAAGDGDRPARNGRAPRERHRRGPKP